MKKVLRNVLLLTSLASPLYSQDKKEDPTVNVQSVFYGDNTEYLSNIHRDGETLLGSHWKMYLDWPLGSKAHLYLGGFGDIRSGSSKSFEMTKPIVTLTLGSESNRFVMGTLITHVYDGGKGPEHVGPHGMLPMLQKDQLAFERGYETGLQWLKKGKLDLDVWMNWQALNTPEHREHFDTGLVARYGGKEGLSAGAQIHWVHWGGQLYHTGAVSDSLAGGPGLVWQKNLSNNQNFSAEVYGLMSKNMPDREIDETKKTGHAGFSRITYRNNDWRAHGTFALTNDFASREGDPNYGMLRDDAAYVKRGTKTYGEAGLAKFFRPAKGLEVEVSGRLMWTDGHRDYGYRVRASLDRTFNLIKK